MHPLPVLLILLSTVLHASWNLLGHHRRSNPALFLQALMVIGSIGVVPMVALQVTREPFPRPVWALAMLSGICLSMYYVGLTMGYRDGEFGLVYPAVRAIPVLMLAVADVIRGSFPSSWGWAGLALVFGGCLLMPQLSVRQLALHRYFNRTVGWILLSAAGTAGYTLVDKIASSYLPKPGPAMAAQYCVTQFLFAVPFLWLTLAVVDQQPTFRATLADWKWPAAAAALTFGAYWLVLWAYQLTPFTSYVVALRQFSIVLGTVGAIVLFKERVWPIRVTGIALIVVGIALVSLKG